jgi:hypothetical protein
MSDELFELTHFEGLKFVAAILCPLQLDSLSPHQSPFRGMIFPSEVIRVFSGRKPVQRIKVPVSSSKNADLKACFSCFCYTFDEVMSSLEAVAFLSLSQGRCREA